MQCEGTVLPALLVVAIPRPTSPTLTQCKYFLCWLSFLHIYKLWGLAIVVLVVAMPVLMYGSVSKIQAVERGYWKDLCGLNRMWWWFEWVVVVVEWLVV